MSYSYDDKCEELARHFLDGLDDYHSENDVKQLAQTLQDAVEDWFVLWKPALAQTLKDAAQE